MTKPRAWLAAWAGWTALALFFAVSNSLTYRSTGRPANWVLTLERSLSEWWLWAALTPPVAWLARRYPLHGRRFARHLAVHAAAGVLVAFVKTMAERAIFALLTGFWMYFLLSTLAFNIAIYGAIVAAAHGAEYYRRSREREQLEARLAETRLQLLGMQLQPHFLFNALNTIAETVHEDPDKADAMIGGLSDLLRRTLDLGSSQEITLAEELALVTSYLDIQKARFGDRLQVRFDVDDEVRACRVPALLLQPLVENAIQHGLSQRLDAGRIAIEARATADEILIAVTDDGRGEPLEGVSDRGVRLSTSAQGFGGPAVAFGEGGQPELRPEGVGLGNTRARLDALYGAAAQLELSRIDGGTRVSIRLPRRV